MYLEILSYLLGNLKRNVGKHLYQRKLGKKEKKQLNSLPLFYNTYLLELMKCCDYAFFHMICSVLFLQLL